MGVRPGAQTYLRTRVTKQPIELIIVSDFFINLHDF